MYRRKLLNVMGVSAILCLNGPLAAVADSTACPVSIAARSIMPQPSDLGAASPAAIAVKDAAILQVLEKAAAQPPDSKLAGQAEDPFTDRILALGIAIGLLAFAFIRKSIPSIPSAIPSLATDDHPPLAANATSVEPAMVQPAAAALLLEGPTKLAAITQQKPGKDDVVVAPVKQGNVIVPIDFSENSEYAIRLALRWRKPNDRLNIVYCVNLENAFPPDTLTPLSLLDSHPAFAQLDSKTVQNWTQLPWGTVLPLAMQAVERWAVDEFSKLSQTIGLAQEPVEFHLLHGDPVDQILTLSEDSAAGLMVMAMHRHSMSDGLIGGSHVEKLLHASRVPLLVACEPSAAQPGFPQDIVITTDYSEESLTVFLVLKDLLQNYKPSITVLTVETAYQSHPNASVLLEGLEQAFRALGMPLANVKIYAADVESGILEHVKIHKPQLIAMSSHGRLGFAELIHPSVTKAILHDAGVPILVVHSDALPATPAVSSLSDLLRMITG